MTFKIKDNFFKTGLILVAIFVVAFTALEILTFTFKRGSVEEPEEYGPVFSIENGAYTVSFTNKEVEIFYRIRPLKK
jgi:hypothetical protein